MKPETRRKIIDILETSDDVTDKEIESIHSLLIKLKHEQQNSTSGNHA